MRPTDADIRYYLGTNKGRVTDTRMALRQAGFKFRDSEIRKAIRAIKSGHQFLKGNQPMFFTHLSKDAPEHQQFLLNVQALMEKLGGVVVLDSTSATLPDAMVVQGTLDIKGTFLTVRGELELNRNLVNPVSGMAGYAPHEHILLFHPKQRMEPVATMPDAPARMVWSTGAANLPDGMYRPTRAGLRAERMHNVGGILYLPSANGATLHPVQSVEEDGSFHFFNYLCTEGEAIRMNGNVYAINFGDIHAECLSEDDIDVLCHTMKVLQPQRVFLHDLLHFEARNHHEALFKFNRFRKHVVQADKVEQNIRVVQDLLTRFVKTVPNTEFVIVPSNHNDAFDKWVNTPCTDSDYKNIRFWHECNLLQYQALEDDPTDSRGIMQMVLERDLPALVRRALVFPHRNESIKYKGIEFNLHGDQGANGSRGSAKQIDSLGMKANIGHVHSPSLLAFVFAAGTVAYDHGYNKGLSSWHHAMIVTYTDGSRTLTTYESMR